MNDRHNDPIIGGPEPSADSLRPVMSQDPLVESPEPGPMQRLRDGLGRNLWGETDAHWNRG